MRTRAALLTTFLLLGAARALAATEPTIPYEEFTLLNGLRVFLSEDHRAPQVTVDIWYHVGAANQGPGKSGFAHLFEHMMFAGSQHVPDPDKVLAAIGAGLGGSANGSTNFDRTNYFETVPASQLPTALWIESDRMGFLLPTLDAKKLATQRDVVSNERRQRIENQPYGRAYLELCDTLYPKPHPYYQCVIGSIEEIQAASVADVQGFFRQFYNPRNATLAIVGDFDPRVARELVTRYFGDIPGGPEPKRPDVPQPRLEKVVEKTITDPVARIPQLQMIWNGGKPFAPDEAPGDLLSVVLGGSKTSRLYKRLVLEKQIASGVYAGNATLGLGGYFQIVATAREGHTVAEMRREVESVLEDFRKSGPTPAELERAKRTVVGSLVRSVERVAGKADQLNAYAFWTGDPGYLAKDIARYRAVTLAQVHDAARTLLPTDRMLVLDVEPSSNGAAGARP
ncbi:MAG TPA: pitrilysin family protein [Myxococcaceae bacterium]|nr:pitrilysin family protein [Myxococcaceae bacterium]